MFRLFCLVAFIMCFVQIQSVQASEKDPKVESLKEILNHFNVGRHHVTNPAGKKATLQYISQKFQDFGLITWTENFKPDFPQYATGVNVVGMLPGRHAGTPKDNVILIGAHYDTMRTTSHGTDDNGSGVTTMLQTAKQLATENKECKREFTVMFVAFDFEEWEDCSNKIQNPKCACANLGCGSRAFVLNFTRWFNGKDGSVGSFQGAIIMDTVLNYNTTPYSQSFPPMLYKVLPDVYRQLQDNDFKGDFMFVSGRRLDDDKLLDTFSYFYNGDNVPKIDDEYEKFKLLPMKIPFYGPPNKLPRWKFNALLGFFRSDHYSFWVERQNKTSMSAIFLSDTANHRGYMARCYHKDCDNMKAVTSDSFLFMAKTSNAIVNTANYLAMNMCPIKKKPQDQGHQNTTSFVSIKKKTQDQGICYKPWVVGVTAFFVALAVLAIAGAVIFLRYWKVSRDGTAHSRFHNEAATSNTGTTSA